jgi:hypothetical protein
MHSPVQLALVVSNADDELTEERQGTHCADFVVSADVAPELASLHHLPQATKDRHLH